MFLIALFYRGFVRPFFFLFPPEIAHSLVLALLKVAAPWARWWGPFFKISDPRGAVVIGTGAEAVRFSNPVGLAAGFDKDAEVLPSLVALGFGFIEVGTVTPRPQSGNPRPRLFRFPHQRALVNRLGFNNAGVEAMARRLEHFPRGSIPLGINIGKNKDTPLERASEDYQFCLDRLFDFGDFFIVNVSSPNTPGLRSLQSVEVLGPLLRSLRQRTDGLCGVRKKKRPLLFVKVSPDESDYAAIVETVVASGFDGLVATNTTRDRTGLPPGAPKEGGLSGAPLRNSSTEVLRKIAQASRGRLILIGVGGVFRAEDALEKILAGASLVELYTGFVYGGPVAPKEVARRLPRLTARSGFESVQGAVGKAL